ncbi:MAG TPA: hypothetical protein PLA94_18440, partial [Myxococcota bacterium]|nr:hypothetical protein [Myxococcota bacterium]
IATRPRRKGKADQSVALLFDQFEEILTADPTAVEQKRAFFDQLGEVLENRLYWALLILREDYLGAFAPYREQIPTGMANSFRLDLLSLEAARMAAVEPALSANRTFPAADRLVHDLSTIMVQQPDGSFRAEAGLYVEPVQLQVVCRRLWAAMPPEDRVIGESDLARFADVSRSLGAYYADAVRLAAGGDLGRERAIREWVGNQLIVGGIRSQVRREPERSGGLGNALIDALRESYLVRAEQRAGALWFELSHDRMVEPVQRDNADWEQEHLHPLQIQGKLWNGQGRPDSLLLGPTALTEALAWAAQNPSMVTPTEADFLARAKELREAEARQRARELRSARRQRWLSAILAVVGFFALIAMGISLWAYGQANQERKAADEQRANALEAQRKATDAAQSAKEAAAQAEQERAAAALAKGIAENERAAADQARLDADAQRLLAIAALAKAREAEQEQRQALKETRRQAMLAHDTLAMLAVGELAPDAARTLPFLADVESPEEARGWTEAAALALLYPAPTWRLPGSSLERLGVKGGQIAAVGSDGRLVVVNPAGELSGRPAAPGGPAQDVPAFVQPSPDGAWVVYGGRQPQIVPSSGEVGTKLAADGQSLWSADFDPSGNWLVGSMSDGTAALWKRVPTWGRRYQSQAIKAPSPVNIWKVQFSPDGQKWLAAGSDGQVILRDLAGTELARTPSAAEIATYLQEKGPDSNDLVGPHLCQMVGLVDAVFAPVGEKVLIVGSDQVQRVWDYRQGVCTQPAMQRVVKSAVWLPDGAHTVYLEE